MKKIWLVLVGSLIALSLISCEKKSEGKNEVKYKDTLSIAYNAQPSTFDPMITGATATAEVGRLVFESLFEMDSTTKRPTPGQEKMVSVRTEPPRRVPKFSPITVTIGISAFFIMCFQITFCSVIPLLLAVSM